MSRTALKRIPLRTDPFAGWSRFCHHVLFALFLIQLALVSAREFMPESRFSEERWPDGLLLVLAAATTMAALARWLPGQNVMLAGAIIAVIGSAVHVLGALTSMPFGPFTFTEHIGQQLFPPLPWAIPLLWIVLILNSRGVGRLILRPWRKTRAYGFWLMGITALLTVLLDLALEPYAVRIRHFWLWDHTRGGFTWFNAPWVNFFGWAVTTLLILAFATPSLINKKAVKSPADYHPLMVWLLLNALCAIGAGVHQMWLAVGAIVGACIATTAFAVRGARW